MALPAALQYLSLPVIGAPLFIASCPALVIAQCKAGIVGSFPALNARPAEMLEQWLQQIEQALTDHRAAHPEAVIGPIAVNQIVHQSSRHCGRRPKKCWMRFIRMAALCCTTSFRSVTPIRRWRQALMA
jgi:nitronate monooxygenase